MTLVGQHGKPEPPRSAQAVERHGSRQLRMPMDMALGNDIGRLQYYQRVQGLLDRLDGIGLEVKNERAKQLAATGVRVPKATLDRSAATTQQEASALDSSPSASNIDHIATLEPRLVGFQEHYDAKGQSCALDLDAIARGGVIDPIEPRKQPMAARHVARAFPLRRPAA